MHPGQGAVVERLGSERDAVDSHRHPPSDSVVADVVRVGLDRDFGIGGEDNAAAQQLQQPAHTFASEPRWSSASQIQRVELPRIPGVMWEAKLDLSLYPRQVAVDRHVLT